MNGDKTIIFKIILTLVLILFSSRLFYLQVYNSDYRSLSEENIVHLETIYPSRGIIIDRNDFVLVENRPNYDFYIIHFFILGCTTCYSLTTFNCLG